MTATLSSEDPEPVEDVTAKATDRQKISIANLRLMKFGPGVKGDKKTVWPEFQIWSSKLVGKGHIYEYSQEEAKLILAEIQKLPKFAGVAS